MAYRFFFAVVSCLILVSVFQPVRAVSDEERFSAGGFHSCRIEADNTVVCRGDNYYTQSDPPAGTFTQISGGETHTCAVKSDSTLACWGSNDLEESTAPAGTFLQVSAGSGHTCAVKSDDTAVCWGDNAHGESTPPAETFTQVSVGADHTCGLKTDSTIVCWGDNLFSQSIPPSGTFTQVSAGWMFTCGLKTDNTIACWGDNQANQIDAPTGTYTQISAGGMHSCALKSDQSVTCWGLGQFGQTTVPAGTYTQVSAGGMHTCGLKTDQTLLCWGENRGYQLFGAARDTLLGLNGSFENLGIGNQPDIWKGINLSRDKRVCNTETVQVAFEGNCAYKFVGGPLENSKLSNKPATFGRKMLPGDTFQFSFHYRTKGAALRLKVKMLVFYIDDEFPKDVIVQNITTPATEYTEYTLPSYTLLSSRVQKIKVMFQNYSVSGKIYLDAARMIFTPMP